jgi:hypothetical protein
LGHNLRERKMTSFARPTPMESPSLSILAT